jgi:hypothetical protein
MPSSKEYWLHAQQCLELAKEAEDFYVKSALIELAETAAPMVLTEPPSRAFVIAGVLVAVGGG